MKYDYVGVWKRKCLCWETLGRVLQAMSGTERVNTDWLFTITSNVEMEASRKQKSEQTEEVMAGQRLLIAREHWGSCMFRWAQVRRSNFIEEESVEDYVEFT